MQIIIATGKRWKSHLHHDGVCWPNGGGGFIYQNVFSKLQISENILRDIKCKKNTAFFFKWLAGGDSTGSIKKKSQLAQKLYCV